MSTPLDITLIYNEKTFCIPLTVTNTTGVSTTDVNVELQEVPTGVSYLSDNLGKGTYDTISRIWNIPLMGPNEVVTGELCFTVDDNTEAPYRFNFIVAYGS